MSKMRKLIITLILMNIFTGCGILLHKSITIDSVDCERTTTFSSVHNNKHHYIIFPGPDSTAFPENSRKRKFYRHNNPHTSVLFILIGTEKSKLDSYPIKPKKISKIWEKKEEYIVYKYDQKRDPFEYMNVYIKDDKVVRMRGRIFRDAF